MMERKRWQFCQVEVQANNIGYLRQFVADRDPTLHELHGTWPGMIGKLGEQGWELIAVLPTETGRGKNPLTYVFRRPM